MYRLVEPKPKYFRNKPRKHVMPLVTPGLYLAVAAKKHVTVYTRKREAPGAGHPEIKTQFKKCAAETRGIKDRVERNAKIRACMINWLASVGKKV